MDLDAVSNEHSELFHLDISKIQKKYPIGSVQTQVNTRLLITPITGDHIKYL